MVAATGGLEMFDEESMKCKHGGASKKCHKSSSNLKSAPEAKAVCCCIIHCKQNSTNKSMKLQEYFTTKRYSREFISFLCQCLSFEAKVRPSADKLLQHPWFSWKQSKKECEQPSVALRELLSISQLWRQELPVEYQGTSEKQLVRICEAMSVILPCCEDWNSGKQDMLKNGNKTAVKTLAMELGLDEGKVWDKIKETFDHARLNITTDNC